MAFLSATSARDRPRLADRPGSPAASPARGEGLSAAAFSDYALSQFKALVEGLSHLRREIDAASATGPAAPVAVWRVGPV